VITYYCTADREGKYFISNTLTMFEKSEIMLKSNGSNLDSMSSFALHSANVNFGIHNLKKKSIFSHH